MDYIEPGIWSLRNESKIQTCNCCLNIQTRVFLCERRCCKISEMNGSAPEFTLERQLDVEFIAE